MATWFQGLETQGIGFIKPSNEKPFIIGVAGGSGSGKTYFARNLADLVNRFFKEEICEIVFQDNFYHDQSAKFDHDGGSVNFDHPDSIDFELLAICLKKIKSGVATEIPIYDFATHKRQLKTLKIQPKKVILVDGILIFHKPEVRELFDEMIFFETPEELRFQRRLERDVKERGRTADGVKQQFVKQVKPMHDLFVEPSKAYAQSVIKDIGHFESYLQQYFEKIRKLK